MTKMEGEALRIAAGEAQHAAPGGPQPVVSSDALLAGRRVLMIAHGPEIYTLRLTRQNKLLLTK